MTGNVSHDGLSISERGNTWWERRHCQRTQTAELESPAWSPVAARMVQCYPLITTMSSLTIINPLHDLGHHYLSPTEQMTCPTLLVTRGIWDYSSTGRGWPGLVVMFTVQAMTFLSAVRAKAKHPTAICPSRMEHNSGIETSASNDNQADRWQYQGKSHTVTTVNYTEERGGLRTQLLTTNFHLNDYIAFTWQ